MQNQSQEIQLEELPQFDVDTESKEKLENSSDTSNEEKAHSFLNLDQAIALVFQTGFQNTKQKASQKFHNNKSMVEYPENTQEDVFIEITPSKSLNASRSDFENEYFKKEDELTLVSNKKWVFVKICKFGITSEQIIDALKYIKDLPNQPREQMLQSTIDHVITGTNNQNNPIKVPQYIDNLTEKMNNSKNGFIKEAVEDLVVIKEELKSNLKKEEEAQCGICCEDIVLSQIKKPLGCNHNFCHQCYISYLSEKISSNQLLQISCPENGCSELLTDDTIFQLLPSSKFNEYKTFKKNLILNQNPNLRWCLRPECGKYVVGSPNNIKVVCECGAQICFLCRNEFHPKRSCEEMLDKSYKDYLKRNCVQRCPKCKSGVEKHDGCNHMSCYICSYEWCWLCGGKFSKAHYSFMNPFGCAGLRQGRNKKQSWPCLKIYLWRLLRVILWLILLCFMPIVWVVVSAITPILLWKSLQDSRRRKRRSHSGYYYSRRYKPSCCCGFFLILIGRVLLPFWMLFTLIYGICMLYHKFKS